MLSSIIIPKRLGHSGNASKNAISAVFYRRVASSAGEILVSMIMAKTKTARLNETSIPRLELCTAVLLLRLVAYVRGILRLAPTSQYYLWSDSTYTLNRIHGHPLRWKTYITNRVSEIQTTLPEAVWHHIPGVDNPADCASRGLSPERLETS